MNDKVSQGRKPLKALDRLESGRPERELDIISLKGAVDLELEMLRQFGTTGSASDTPSVVSAFLKVLSQDNDPRIRSSVAKELGKITYDIMHLRIDLFQNIPQLVERGLISALEDESPKVRKSSTKALRKIGTPSALAAVPPKPWWKFW